MSNNINVYITHQAHAKLWAYIRSVKTEIGGWGYARLEGNNLIWNDTFLVPQVSTSSEVDFDTTGGDAVAIEKAAADGVLGTEGFVWVSWHSHHTMKAFWSPTDDTRIKALREAGIPALFSFVGCHDYDYKARLDFFSVDHFNIQIPQVTMDGLTIYADPQDDFWAGIYADVADNLRERPKPAPNVAKPWHTNAAPAKRTEMDPDKKQMITEAMRNENVREEINWIRQGDEASVSIEDAFEIRELISCGMSYYEATELVKGEEYFITAGGVS